jgi:polar amino acid transport system permease protein
MSAARPMTMKRVLNAPLVAIALYVGIVGGIVWVSYTGAQQMGYNWQWY